MGAMLGVCVNLETAHCFPKWLFPPPAYVSFYFLPVAYMWDERSFQLYLFNKCKMVLSILLMCLFDIFVFFLVKVYVPKPFLFFFLIMLYFSLLLSLYILDMCILSDI